MWSVSDSRVFRRCPRQWYYKHIVANAIAKDEYRRKMYLLSKLQSVSAWRGQIVDDTISNFVIDRVRRGHKVTLDEAKRVAHKTFERELAFALQHGRLIGDGNPSAHDFVALHSLYYHGSLSQTELDTAQKEIGVALSTLFQMEKVKADLKAARLLITQRTLVFQHCGASVRAVPDLIAFFDTRPPLIVDWKVHAFGIREAWLQLAVYAMALTRCNAHKDFPTGLKNFSATDVELIEVQLLTGMTRSYRLDAEEIEKAELYIADSVNELDSAIDGRKYAQLTEDDFAVTSFSSQCKSCPFREVCWRVV
jgi:hypothetical protein